VDGADEPRVIDVPSRLGAAGQLGEAGQLGDYERDGGQPERPPSLTERRMARTRRQLAEVAAGLFLERGYEAVTVEEIAAVVEVSPRTFFRYFPSKDDVLDEILVNEVDEVIAALRQRPRDEPVADSLRAAARSWVSTAERDARTVRLFGLVRRTPVLRTRWLARRTDDQEALAEILAERLGAGPESPIPLLAAGAMIGVLTTIFEFWVEHLDEAERLALIDEAIDALVDGFGISGRAPSALGKRSRRRSG
jgi:AcrR family transcriptional regulator